MADEASSWNDLHAAFPVKRINHQEAYSADGACTNGAEEFFSRLRRAEIGHHHHLAGAYLARYAQELGPEVLAGYLKCAIVRNPWDRLLSDYIYQKRKSVRIGEKRRSRIKSVE